MVILAIPLSFVIFWYVFPLIVTVIVLFDNGIISDFSWTYNFSLLFSKTSNVNGVIIVLFNFSTVTWANPFEYL